MTVRVLLFASLRSKHGDCVPIELPAPATVGALKSLLRSQGLWVDGARVAVNRAFVPDELTIQQHDEVAIIPPVSGG
jgi:molybdopterin converting factor subunit 1